MASDELVALATGLVWGLVYSYSELKRRHARHNVTQGPGCAGGAHCGPADGDGAIFGEVYRRREPSTTAPGLASLLPPSFEDNLDKGVEVDACAYDARRLRISGVRLGLKELAAACGATGRAYGLAASMYGGVHRRAGCGAGVGGSGSTVEADQSSAADSEERIEVRDLTLFALMTNLVFGSSAAAESNGMDDYSSGISEDEQSLNECAARAREAACHNTMPTSPLASCYGPTLAAPVVPVDSVAASAAVAMAAAMVMRHGSGSLAASVGAVARPAVPLGFDRCRVRSNMSFAAADGRAQAGEESEEESCCEVMGGGASTSSSPGVSRMSRGACSSSAVCEGLYTPRSLLQRLPGPAPLAAVSRCAVPGPEECTRRGSCGAGVADGGAAGPRLERVASFSCSSPSVERSQQGDQQQQEEQQRRCHSSKQLLQEPAEATCGGGLTVTGKCGDCADQEKPLSRTAAAQGGGRAVVVCAPSTPPTRPMTPFADHPHLSLPSPFGQHGLAAPRDGGAVAAHIPSPSPSPRSSRRMLTRRLSHGTNSRSDSPVDAAAPQTPQHTQPVRVLRLSSVPAVPPGGLSLSPSPSEATLPTPSCGGAKAAARPMLSARPRRPSASSGCSLSSAAGGGSRPTCGARGGGAGAQHTGTQVASTQRKSSAAAGAPATGAADASVRRRQAREQAAKAAAACGGPSCPSYLRPTAAFTAKLAQAQRPAPAQVPLAPAACHS